MTDILEAAHKKSSMHREEVLASVTCGCFYCQTKFPPRNIKEWVDPRRSPTGATALCPNCGIDSVIGDAAGFPLTADFLADMHERWFKTTRKLSE
jgi:hypothetical protein